MITVENLSYSIPQKELYNKISFTLEDGQHCAFLGSNGTGKSTLIDMITRPEDFLFDGKIKIREGIRIGYVKQYSQKELPGEMTVFDYIAEEYHQVSKKLADLCTQMETAADFDALLEEYQTALDHLTAIGGDSFESDVTKKLNLANLGDRAELSVHKLSGGEFKLVQIIKNMMVHPDLLIMDEPDVFLDFEHLCALRELINAHKGLLLVVTHNRYLLHHCFDKILHLENTQLQEFEGRYIDYNYALLEEKIDQQEQAFLQEEEIRRNEAIVDKLRSDATYYTCASRGRALHARVSLLERLKAGKTTEPFVEIKCPDIQFHTDSEIAETEPVLTLTDYEASFSCTLLEHINLALTGKEKVALIGPNGTGKTTLLRDIFKNEKSSIKLSDDAITAFLTQVPNEGVKEDNTIRDEFYDAGMNSDTEIKALLSSYCFSEECLDQKISKLSGGEKNLIGLAKISVGNANFLLLDEPTSHLDTFTQVALEKAINEYNGTIFMISHDFYTIANCVDYVLMIEDKGIRKISCRKFRKMIYENHFSKDYLQLEDKKKTLEARITQKLLEKDFKALEGLMNELYEVNQKL